MMRKALTFEYKGKLYTIKELLELSTSGVTYSALKHRLLKQKMSVEDAITLHLIRSLEPANIVYYNGKQITLKEVHAFAHESVTLITLKARVNVLKWDIAKALVTPARPSGKKQKFEYNGVIYTGAKKFKEALETDMDFSHFNNLILQHEYDVSKIVKAVQKYENRKTDVVQDPVSGEPSSFKYLAEKYNVKYSTAKNRINGLKWTLPEALEIKGRGIHAKILHKDFSVDGLVVCPIKVATRNNGAYRGDFVDEEGNIRIRCLIEKTQEYVYLTPEEIVNFKEGD